MTAATAVQVHHRPEAVGDFLHFLEVILALVEESALVRRQSEDRSPGIGRAAAHARVAGEEIDRGGDLRMEEEQTCYRREQ